MEWFSIKVKGYGGARIYFPQRQEFILEGDPRSKTHPLGRYFHVLTVQGGYRWFHEKKIDWLRVPKELWDYPLPEPEPEPESPKPEITHEKPESKEPEDQLWVSPETYSQLSEDWRQIFVEKVKGD